MWGLIVSIIAYIFTLQNGLPICAAVDTQLIDR